MTVSVGEHRSAVSIEGIDILLGRVILWLWGKSVRLFLTEGTPGGLLTAEIMNWTGHVIAASRSAIGSLLARDEAKRTGVYILTGDDPEGYRDQLVYIGEGDAVDRRLKQHAQPEAKGGKDFWERAIVLTSKDANLTKAHARYLESRFISLAHQAGRARLANGTNPSDIDLPEADASDMEYFIEQAKIVLPVLGMNIFRSPATMTVRDTGAVAPKTSPTFVCGMRNPELTATAQEMDGEFTVFKGAQARYQWIAGAGVTYAKLRESLEEDGTLAPSVDGKTMRFTRDYVFSSPSAAAATVLGRSANGRTSWKAQGSGKTYGEWENEGID